MAATLLDASFTDIDEVIVRETGNTIPELFAHQGEHAFRALERQWMSRALSEAPHVIAPGGGWAAQPGNLESVESAGLVIYLSVTPEVAAARLDEARDRPLLKGDPHHRLEQLLQERERFYLRAAFEIPTDAMTPARVAEAVASVARRYGGW
jgi:shikimate kinase